MNINDAVTEQRWREGLEVGSVVVLKFLGSTTVHLGNVVRCTPKQLLVKPEGMFGERRFNIASGREVGAGGKGRILMPNEHLIGRAESARNVRRFTRLVKLDNVSDEEIAVMLHALDAHRAAKAGGA